MKEEKLIKLLEKTDDKLSIFASLLDKYNIDVKEFLNLIDRFLTDEEKMKLFEYSNFKQLGSSLKGKVINLISDENILLQMLNDDNIMNEFQKYQIIDIMKGISDNGKQTLLYNQKFVNKHQFTGYEIKVIISSLTENTRADILLDNELITKQLKLGSFQIAELVENLSDEDIKDKAMRKYQFEIYEKKQILKTYSNSHRLSTIMQLEDFRKVDILEMLRTLDAETLSKSIKENKEFYIKNKISPYNVVKTLNVEQQIDFVKKLEDMDLTLNEKRKILVVLKEETKQKLDTNNLPKEYKSALSMKVTEGERKIILDLERNLEDYTGLDNLISVNPENFTEEQRNKFIKLCDICPNMEVFSSLSKNVIFSSNATEYKEAEEWIESIITNLKPEYSKAQKMAVIDNAIGKKISYSPDFAAEVFDESDSRALWRIISSGYGVCNGIARVEQYIFDRVGIESELVASNVHAFLKINNIELPLANGENVKGSTILDPTWNLAAHRFSGRPNNFCISYEQARKNDIDITGKDNNCHKNDEQLQDATLNLDDQSLRKLFSSVGLAREDGQFPIRKLILESQCLDEVYESQLEQNIRTQFSLLKENCPEFATCQNSSMVILKDVLLKNKNMNFNKCVVNRVYNRTDKEKSPIVYVYINSDELENKFYVADKEEGQFIELSSKEFIQQYECYENDLKKSKRN